MPIHSMPLVRVEIALQTIVEDRLATLLIRREEAPWKDRWALPGGVIRVDLDGDLAAAAARVARERLEVEASSLQQLCAVGAAGRDPRGPSNWALSIVYQALVPQSSVSPVAGKRVRGLRWVAADQPLPATQMAFDHAALVAQAVSTTRARIAALDFPPGFIPERFTLGGLQRLCEQVLGTSLDKSSFRRKLRDRGLVEAIAGEEQRGEAHRPSAIYRLVAPALSLQFG